jgi:hydrogenase maturation factor
VSSAGTLVVTVPPEGVDGVLAALESRGTAAAAVGTVERGSGAYVDGERIEPPETDSSWAVYAAYTERATESEE